MHEQIKKIITDDMVHLHATGDTSVRSSDESKTRLFSSCLLWAPFAVSGPGTQIHPSGLVEPPKKAKRKKDRSSFLGNLFSSKHDKVHVVEAPPEGAPPLGLADISDGDLRREAKILRSEGGVELADAAEAELRRRRQAKVDEVKRRYSAVSCVLRAAAQ